MLNSTPESVSARRHELADLAPKVGAEVVAGRRRERRRKLLLLAAKMFDAVPFTANGGETDLAPSVAPSEPEPA